MRNKQRHSLRRSSTTTQARGLYLAALIFALIAAVACDDGADGDAAAEAGDVSDASDVATGAAGDATTDDDTSELDAAPNDTSENRDVVDEDVDTSEVTDAVADAETSGDGASDAGETSLDAVGDTSSESGIVVRFELGSDDFFAMPWPHNYRRDERGAPILRTFPTGGVGLVEYYVETVELDVDGFSTNPVIYFALDSDPGVEAWPTPAESLTESSTVQLFELGEGCGRRVPVESDVYIDEDPFTPINTLRVSPVPGFVLRPATTYAAVVARTLSDGAIVRRPDLFDAALRGESGDAALDATYAPLLDCADAAGLVLDDIAVASVFTTQNPVGGTQRIVEYMRNPELVAAPEPELWERWGASGDVEIYRGTFNTPIFQQGTTPYTGLGGRIEFDANGYPVEVRAELVPFSLAWRRDAEGPLPVLVWLDGTGAGPGSHFGDLPFVEAIERGFAVASFTPQFHTGRAAAGVDAALATYNYFNPDSGRNTFRQQVADTIAFVRMLQEYSDTLDGAPELNTEQLVYGGHSQGGLVGAMLAGTNAGFASYVLNGVGATLSITLIERRDPVDIANLIRTALRIRGLFDRKHPVAQLVQTAGDIVDPANYARSWYGEPGAFEGTNVLLVNGDLDVTTSVPSINSMMIAADADVVVPVGWDVDPFGIWTRGGASLPIAGNRIAGDGTPITIAAYAIAGATHSAIYETPEAAEAGANLWLSSIGAGTPTLAVD